MLKITDKAQGKVKEILDSQQEHYAGLRVQIVGGGCSGFQYQMGFEKQANGGDEILELQGFKVFVDKGSMIYLDGTEIDYIESLTGAGFKFPQPQRQEHLRLRRILPRVALESSESRLRLRVAEIRRPFFREEEWPFFIVGSRLLGSSGIRHAG